MTSDKLPDSPSKFPYIQLWMTRRIWHCIKSHLRPYSTHPFNYSSKDLQGSLKIFKNLVKLFKDHGRSSSRSSRIVEDLRQDHWRSSSRTFKDLWRSSWRSSRISEDPSKIPEGSLKILPKIVQGPLKIFKDDCHDCQGSLKIVAKIPKDC